MKRILCATLAVMMLGGCASMDISREEGIGATLGAVAGGVIGYQFGDGTGQALTTATGAVIGGVAGYLLGDSVDGD